MKKTNQKRPFTPERNNLYIGKLPPQAIDLEEAVLGACLLEKTAITEVSGIITAESFYKEENQKIFAAIISLYQKNNPADILTVVEFLKNSGELDVVGGPYYISTLTSRVSSTAHCEYHALLIQQKYIAREMIRLSSQTIHDAYDDTTDIFELLDRTEREIMSVGSFQSNKTIVDINTATARRIKEIEAINNRKGELTGVPSGFTSIDRLTNGWQKPDLVIIAARPGMGKTALALSMAIGAAQLNRHVAFFSLEMSEGQITDRKISLQTGIPLYKLKKGGLTDADFNQMLSQRDLPIYIDDTPALSILDLRRRARKLKTEKKIELIIVDYLQLMTVGASDIKLGNREQEISLISRSLKALAKELDMPIIALSQLSREVEKRGNKKPILADLRESGAIEQDADMVCFIHNPSYYDKDNPEYKGYAVFIIEKHRNGALDEIKLKWEDYLTKFSDWSDYKPEPIDYTVAQKQEEQPF